LLSVTGLSFIELLQNGDKGQSKAFKMSDVKSFPVWNAANVDVNINNSNNIQCAFLSDYENQREAETERTDELRLGNQFLVFRND